MRKSFQGVSAFTLIEILITVIIVGIIASLAMMQYTNTIERYKAHEGELILYSKIGQVLSDLIEKPPAGNFSNVWAEALAHNSGYFNTNLALVQNIVGSDKCSAVAVFRKGGSSVAIPNTCGIGNMGSSNNSMYSLSLSITQPYGVKKVKCSDPGTGICVKLGYSYNSDTTQAWGGTTLNIN